MDNNSNDNMVFDNAAVDLKLEPISELHVRNWSGKVVLCRRLCRYVKSLFCIKLEIQCCYICREICWASIVLWILQSNTHYERLGWSSYMQQHCYEWSPTDTSQKIKSTIVNVDEVLKSVSRGGLAHPTEICLTICAVVFSFFQQVKDDYEKLTKFLTTSNQREVFLRNIQDIVKKYSSFNCLLKVKCSHNHFIFVPLVITIFNSYAQNLHKTLCTGRSIDLDLPGDKGTVHVTCHKKKLCKLTSKTNLEK